MNQSISAIVCLVSLVVISKATGLRIASGFQSKRILGLSFDSIFHHWKASIKCLCDPKKEKLVVWWSPLFGLLTLEVDGAANSWVSMKLAVCFIHVF